MIDHPVYIAPNDMFYYIQFQISKYNTKSDSISRSDCNTHQHNNKIKPEQVYNQTLPPHFEMTSAIAQIPRVACSITVSPNWGFCAALCPIIMYLIHSAMWQEGIYIKLVTDAGKDSWS